MNLWEIVTANSKLAVEAGTNFWDHLTNQNNGVGNGAGDVFVGVPLTMNVNDILTMDLDEPKLTMNLREDLSMNLQEQTINANIDESLNVNFK